MKEELQILFSQYTDNILSEEDKNAFESRLINDAQFKSEYDIFLSMNTFLDKKKKAGVALDSLRSFHNETKLENSKSSKKRSNRWTYFLVILVTLLAAIFAYNYFFKPNASKIYAEAYVPPQTPTIRGDKSSLANAMIAYQNGNLEAAIDTLNNSPDINISDKNYWLAEFYLVKKEPDSTLKYIKLLDSKILRDRILYLEILSHFQRKEYNKVSKLINDIPSDMSDYYKNKVFLLK